MLLDLSWIVLRSWFILFVLFLSNRKSSDESDFAYGLKCFPKIWQISLFVFLCISVNLILFSLRLLCRSGETSCNFLFTSLGILSCASCSSPIITTTAFTSGKVDLTKSLYFRCASLSLLVAESFTLLYISGFSKGVFMKRQFLGILWISQLSLSPNSL